MAIHIDIIAHLRQRDLIKEGEQLRRYVDSLEGDINTRWEKAAKGTIGRSKEIVRNTDKQSAAYDTLINKVDSLTLATRRLEEAEAKLASVERRRPRKPETKAKKEKDLAEARREVAQAELEVAFAAQQASKSVNDYTRSTWELNESIDALNKKEEEARKTRHKINTLVGKSKGEFRDLTRVTNKHRRGLEDLHSANLNLIKDNTTIRRQMDRVSEAQERTKREREKFKEMVKEGTASYKQFRDQVQKIRDAHAAERKVINEVRGGILSIAGAHDRAQSFVAAHDSRLRELRTSTKDVRKELESLNGAHAETIRNNNALSRAFNAANNSAHKANEEYGKYKQMARDSSVSAEQLRTQFLRVNSAFKQYREDAEKAREGLSGLVSVQDRANQFVSDHNARLKKLAAGGRDVRREITDLRKANEDVIASNAGLSRTFNSVADAGHRANREFGKYKRMARDSSTTTEQLREQLVRTSDAYATYRQKADDASDALHRHIKAEEEAAARRIAGTASKSHPKFDPGRWAARNLGALTPLGVVTPTLVLPLGTLFFQMANGVIAASQSLALLPAAAGAAGAAFGTLKMATAGFGDTISALIEGDLEKFAEGIHKLAPSAQQAALTIQHLMPQFKQMQVAAQEAFFTDVPQMIYSLTRKLGPAVEEMTTSIAASMNRGLRSVTTLLLSPDGSETVGRITDNIAATFKSLQPAIQPLAEAMLILTDAGAEVLPDVAKDLADIARSFASFLGDARDSGALKEFMDTGWEALKAVGAALRDFGVMLYDVFGLKNQKDIERFRDTMQEMTDLIELFLRTLKTFFEDIASVFKGASDFLNVFGVELDSAGSVLAKLAEAWLFTRFLGWTKDAIKAVRNLNIALMGTATASAATGVAGSTGGLLGALGKAATGLKKLAGPLALIATIGMAIEDMFPNLPFSLDKERPEGAPDRWFSNAVPILPFWEDLIRKGWDKFGQKMADDIKYRQFFDNFDPSETPSSYAMERVFENFGIDPETRVPLFDVPDAPEFVATPGTYELGNIPIGTFPGAQWQVPEGITDLPPDWNNLGKTGYYRTDPFKIWQEQNDLDNARIKAEEARIHLLEVQSDSNKTQDDINKAANDVIQAERDWLEAQRSLKEAERGEFIELATQTERFAEDLRQSLGELGDVLDPDLGISRGLAGMAENLVKFVASVAAAPMLGQMKAQQVMLGFPGGEGTGSGLVGIAAAMAGHYKSPYALNPDELAQWQAAQMFGGAVVPGVNGNTPASLGVPPVTGEPGPMGSNPYMNQIAEIAKQFGLTVTSGLRKGDPGHHGRGEALDIDGPDEVLEQFATHMSKNFGPQLAELIWGRPGFTGNIDEGKPYNYPASTMAEHYGANSHVHIALRDALQATTQTYAQQTVQNALSQFQPSNTADMVAAEFIRQAEAAGFNREQILAGLAVLNQESAMGTNPAAYRPQNQNGTVVTGPFQQDSSYNKYGDRNNPVDAIRGYIDQYINTGQGLANPDPWDQALKVQRPAKPEAGGYNAALLNYNQRGTALQYYSRITGKVPGAPGYQYGGTIDNTLIRATPGEFIVNKRAAQKFRPLLEEINAGRIPGFEDGGTVTNWNPLNLFTGFGRAAVDAGKGLVEAVKHPVETVKAMAPLIGLGGSGAPGVAESWKALGKAVTHWDEWKSDPFGAAGGALFDVGTMFIPGAGAVGGGSKAVAAATRRAAGKGDAPLSPFGPFPPEPKRTLEELGHIGLPGTTGTSKDMWVTNPAYVGHNIPLNPENFYRALWLPDPNDVRSMFNEQGVMHGRGGGWTWTEMSFMPGYPHRLYVNGPEGSTLSRTARDANVIIEGDHRMNPMMGDTLPPDASKLARRGGYAFVKELLWPDVISGKTPIRVWKREAAEGQKLHDVHEWTKVFDSFIMDLEGKASGGWISGRSTGIDNTLIRATPGEFVVNRDSAQKFGPLLEQINRYEDGGWVTPTPFDPRPRSIGQKPTPLDPLPLLPIEQKPTPKTGSGPDLTIPTPVDSLLLPIGQKPTSGSAPKPGGESTRPLRGGVQLLQELGALDPAPPPIQQLPKPAGVPTAGSHIGSKVEPYQGYGPGLSIGGGIAGAIAGAASSAAGLAASGAAGGTDGGAASAAAAAALQIGIQEIQRAIEFGAQATGIGVQGLMETLLPTGGSSLANENWITRLVGGIVGAAPALPNLAGGIAQDALGQGRLLPGVGPSTPEQIAAQQMDPNRTQHTGTGYRPGIDNYTAVNIERYISQSTEARAGQDLARYQPVPGAR